MGRDMTDEPSQWEEAWPMSLANVLLAHTSSMWRLGQGIPSSLVLSFPSAPPSNINNLSLMCPAALKS